MTLAQQLKQEGLEQGREEERYEMAKNLLAEGLSLDLLKKVTKLPDLVLTQSMCPFLGMIFTFKRNN